MVSNTCAVAKKLLSILSPAVDELATCPTIGGVSEERSHGNTGSHDSSLDRLFNVFLCFVARTSVK